MELPHDAMNVDSRVNFPSDERNCTMQSETLLSKDGTSTVGPDTMNVDSSTNVSLGEEEEVDKGRSND